MDSTAKPTLAGPDDVLARGTDKPNGDYERVVREELARVQERLAQLAPVGMTATQSPPEVKIAPDTVHPNHTGANALGADVTAFRASTVESGHGGRSAGRGVARVLIGLLVAGVVVGGGAAWAAYGDSARPLIAAWAPQVGATWAIVSERLGLNSGKQDAAPTQTAAADASAPAAAQPASASPPPASAAAAPAQPDVKQMLQSMAQDIATLEQGIEQLKAGQDQLARDNAKLAEQLKASQDQLSKVMVHAAEHPRPPLPPRPPVVAAARRPPPPPPLQTLPPPQPIAPPPQAVASPAQLDANDAMLPRPPKSVPQQ